MFLEFLSHYNTIVSHMIKHTSLHFLYGTIYDVLDYVLRRKKNTGVAEIA